MNHPRLEYGCEAQTFRRDWMFYVAIQILIFVKTVIFFFFFGKGISYAGQPVAINIPFVAVPVFGNLYHVWEYLFHQLMHVFIAVWVFVYVLHIKRFDVAATAKLFFIATILHNVGYWFTNAHSDWLYSLKDFVIDYTSLWAFFTVFCLVTKFYPTIRKWKIPFFGRTSEL